MSLPVWKFFRVAEEDNTTAVCDACSARIPRGGKKGVKFKHNILFVGVCDMTIFDRSISIIYHLIPSVYDSPISLSFNLC